MVVYLIENTKENDKPYVGSSHDFVSRTKDHLFLGRKYGKGDDGTLYGDIKKYGVRNFRLSILDRSATSPKEMLAIENSWMHKMNSLENGYNTYLNGTTSVPKYWTEHQKELARQKSLAQVKTIKWQAKWRWGMLKSRIRRFTNGV